MSNSNNFTLNVQARTDKGKGASRRLRHAGMVPGVIYGSGEEPQSVMMVHHQLANQLDNEAFYSHILEVSVDGNIEQAILKDLQRHPYKPIVMHFDLLRVRADEAIRVNVPLHFVGEETSPGAKFGGRPSRTMNELEITCLPKDLPEYIEVDVSACEIGDIVHISNIQLPKGVEIASLIGLDDAERAEHDLSVFTIASPKVGLTEDEQDAADAEAAADAASTADAAE